MKRPNQSYPANQARLANQAYIKNKAALIIKPTMVDLAIVLCLPPAGTLGVIQYQECPVIKVGDDVLFQIEKVKVDRTLMEGFDLDSYIEEIRGRIVAIEKPGSNIRPDTKSDRWKIHWVPIDPILIDKVILTISLLKCPKCGKKLRVVNSRVNGNKILRQRVCKYCRLSWLTEETATCPVKLKRKSSLL